MPNVKFTRGRGHGHGKCYGLKNKATGAVHSKCTTKAKRDAQARLLQGVEHGWHPTHRHGGKKH